jgi:hypothetical protein
VGELTKSGTAQGNAIGMNIKFLLFGRTQIFFVLPNFCNYSGTFYFATFFANFCKIIFFNNFIFVVFCECFSKNNYYPIINVCNLLLITKKLYSLRV